MVESTKWGSWNSAYGTRDAALIWQETVAAHLEGLGFKRGRSNPCVFHHADNMILTLVHGDDYASTGDERQLQWLKRELEKKSEIKTTIAGTGPGDVLEGKILNRVIWCTKSGREVEADPRHAELLIEQLGLEAAKPGRTPGVEEAQNQKEDEAPLEAQETRDYRGVAARGNYLGADRPDLQYAVKEACRDMAAPTRKSQRRMKRVVRCLVERPRLIWTYPWQEDGSY